MGDAAISAARLGSRQDQLVRRRPWRNSRELGLDDVRIAMIGYTFYEIDARVKRAAEALVDSGHFVDVYSIRHPTAGQDRCGKLRIFRLSMRKQRSVAARYAVEYGLFCLWAAAGVTMRHARRRYDVIYVHNLPNFLVFAGLGAKLGGAGIVLDVHDPAPELLASVLGRPLAPWMLRLVHAEESASIAFADAIITVNESMRQRYAGRFGREVQVVMNLPDLAQFSPEAPGTGTRGDGNTLVYSGSITLRHGVDLAVQAVAQLAEEFPALRLKIIGAGPAVAAVRDLADSLGVTERVEITGYVANQEIPALLGGSLAGIAAQREDEFGDLVFSMKAAEYAALGLPVICSGIATMRHYFTAEEMLFFEPGNATDLARAIRRVLTYPQEAADRALRCRQALRRLDWPTQRAVLVQTVEQSGRPRRRLAARAARAEVDSPELPALEGENR
jgi:glycosyltransferase involved in cell wall biosynthesis